MTVYSLEQVAECYSLSELCERCDTTVVEIELFIEHGIIEPEEVEEGEAYLSADNYLRLRKALRIHRDLSVNVEGVALAMHLMDEMDALRKQLRLR